MAKHEVVQILDRTFGPGGVLDSKYDTPQARQLLVSITGQEAAFHYRRQIGGPARGLWQFEQGSAKRGGGVYGVVKHEVSAPLLRSVCANLGVPFDAVTIYGDLATNDILACALARCLLLTDPRKLPGVGEVWPAYDYYFRNWRPGKPHAHDWPKNYERAMRMLEGAQN